MDPPEMLDHVTFSVSPFSSSTPVHLLAATLSPPLSEFNLSKADSRERGIEKKDHLPCSCIAPRKVQECLRMKALSIRLSSL